MVFTSFRKVLTLNAGAVLILLFSNPASAGTMTVDGITFETGIISGGNVLQTGNLSATGITGPGQQLEGVGTVAALANAGGLTTTWTSGQNGVELVFEFTGFTSNVVTAPTSNLPGSVSYTGGMINFYVLPAGTSISAGSVAGDIAAVQSGTLFLSETASPEDSSGDTLIEIIPAGDTLSSFSNASAFAFFDITGGAAAVNFNTNSFADAYDIANSGLADGSLTIAISSGGVQNGFPLSGSGTFTGNAAAVPEPSTAVALVLGLALLFLRKRTSRLLPGSADPTYESW